jgi:PAS domain S-box-containing protein
MIQIPPGLARSTLDAAPDAMLLTDPTGVVLFTNRQVSGLFGYAHQELIGANIELLIPGRFRHHHVGHRGRYVASPRMRPMGAGLALFGRRRDGSEFPVEISLSPVEDSGHTLIAAAIRDVTDQKRIEAELIVARDTAESMQALAHRANLAKSRFLATASHDLRQPLQVLALLNGMLRQLVGSPRAAEALAQQEHAVAAMSKLLNALLDISKIESGAIKPEPADFTVAAIFEELRAEFAGMAASKGLRFEIESCGDSVHSDPSLVEQILRNLVSNAVKYTLEGWVRLRCLHEATRIRIDVLDSGVGIEASHLPFIYDEFYQAGVGPNSARDGYGLGLSIVRNLVRLLSLQLDVRSEVGKGTTFSLVLPAGGARGARVPDDAAEPAGSVATPATNAGILVVEDDVIVRRVTTAFLELQDYYVTAAVSLTEALQHVQAGNRVDLLITDYHLDNGETGEQVITAVRRALGATLPAVLLTGDTSTAIRNLPGDPRLRVMSKPLLRELLQA